MQEIAFHCTKPLVFKINLLYLVIFYEGYSCRFEEQLASLLKSRREKFNIFIHKSQFLLLSGYCNASIDN